MRRSRYVIEDTQLFAPVMVAMDAYLSGVPLGDNGTFDGAVAMLVNHIMESRKHSSGAAELTHLVIEWINGYPRDKSDDELKMLLLIITRSRVEDLVPYRPDAIIREMAARAFRREWAEWEEEHGT